MTENKKELKDTKLNKLVLSMERKIILGDIDDKLRCGIMLGVTAIITECRKNPPTLDDDFEVHEYCLPYAIKYAELDDDPIVKLMSKLFLE